MTANISRTIAERKAIRAYLDEEVSATDLARIVEAGRWAPCSGDFHISVVRNTELRQRINDKTHEAMAASEREFLRHRAALPGYQPLYGAPVLILLSGPADAPNSPFNAAVAAENMLLEATELGLGSCFLRSPTFALNVKENQALAREVGIPDDYALQCAIVVGHAAAENKFTLGERTIRGTVSYFD